MNFLEIMEPVTPRDFVDIIAVAAVVYALLLLIRGTRAVQVLLGILVLVGISYLAQASGLVTLRALLENFVLVIPFAVIVIFQDQIRRALATFGDTSILRLGSTPNIESTLDEIVLTTSELSRKRIGGLIVIEGMQGLRDYAEKGTMLDAAVSWELLVNIFNPAAPLHDGAVIVQADRIAAASCFLPLTRQIDIDPELGTRHRAALGISDQTDAIAIVVSEENGQVAMAVDSRLSRSLDSGQLHRMLLEALAQRGAESSSGEEAA